MLDALNRLHDRVNRLIGLVLYRNQMREMLDEKRINLRQYTIINNLLPEGMSHELARVKAQPWFKGLYLKRTDMTQSRDLRGLVERGLIEISGKGKLRLCVP
jgi:hypothetical protein